jgi:hypothetical protein
VIILAVQAIKGIGLIKESEIYRRLSDIRRMKPKIFGRGEVQWYFLRYRLEASGP